MMYLLRFEIYYRRLTDWWISVNQIIAARERRRLVKNQSHMIWWLLRRIYFGYKMTHSVSWYWILIKMEKLYRAHLKSYYTKQRNICVTVESTHSEKPIATVVMFVQLSYKAIWNFTTTKDYLYLPRIVRTWGGRSPNASNRVGFLAIITSFSSNQIFFCPSVASKNKNSQISTHLPAQRVSIYSLATLENSMYWKN